MPGIDSPVRVTLVSHYYPAHRGGVERVAGQLAERLASAGVARIEWHASDCDTSPSLPEVQCVPAQGWNGLERALGIPYPIWSPAALRRVGRAAAAADVVHLHDCLYLPNLVAFMAARLAGRPVLVTQHIGFVPYRNPLLRLLVAAANRVVGRYVLGRASQVVFESETVRQYFARFVRFRAPAQLVPNGVDTGMFVPARSAEPGAPQFLFVGRFVEKKGLPVIRALAERFAKVRWVLAGWGPIDPGKWSLPNVTVVPSPGIPELLPLYQSADLFVLPSTGEGVPLAMQEAMACGTPALVGTETAAGCPGAPILSEATGVPDTVERWVARIESLLREPQALRELRPQVAAFAREHWSWERCVSEYAGALRTLPRAR